jgi:hypothetical protein
MKVTMNPWLITWEAMERRAERAGFNPVAAILHKRSE